MEKLLPIINFTLGQGFKSGSAPKGVCDVAISVVSKIAIVHDDNYGCIFSLNCCNNKKCNVAIRGGKRLDRTRS